jgi:hypothetical protein
MIQYDSRNSKTSKILELPDLPDPEPKEDSNYAPRNGMAMFCPVCFLVRKVSRVMNGERFELNCGHVRDLNLTNASKQVL